MTDEDHWTQKQISLCAACAKHPEVKALVENNLAHGVCGVCGQSEEGVFNPEQFAPLRNLIRALIRLYFDEEDYNSHWGGSSINDILLNEENPIIETAKPAGFPDELIDRITWEGGIYPEYDQGICLYAGHDKHDMRMVQFSIPNTINAQLRNIESRLMRENFYAVEPKMEKLVDSISADIESEIPQGTLWYRGRIGFEHSETHIGFNTVTRIVTPYKGADIGALPPPRASAGRMNRAGVSVLYVASEIDTALAEIRPHPGHTISVAGFRPTRSLRVARFDVPIAGFSSSDKRLNEFALIYHLDSLLSMPVIPEERYLYAATQLLADVLIRRGFDAVSYGSSVGTGRNLCVFEPALFTFDETASAVRYIDKVNYHFSVVATEPPDPF
ncbi:hypothetical protein A0U94_14910 (plasmid) [Gluconobacter albidus]|uniref:RES domain-containing protein n=1 Tax=Gluconobacter albidus TaxID=318683 RepID=UPI00098A426F|nr:RES domain-containing protein [Gluconobacter albidus]AQS92455.1 hypothetical protein A0U94_14910 [Gluconobacter albidus]